LTTVTGSPTTFDTEAVPSAWRLDFWNRVNTEAFSEISVDPRGDSLHGILELREHGPLKLARVYSTPVELRGGLSTESNRRRSGLLLHLQETGSCLNSQLGRSAVLRVGDIGFVDAARPYKVECCEPMKRTVVKIPVGLIARRFDSIEELLAVRVDGTRGIGAILASVVRNFWRHYNDIDTNDSGTEGEAMISTVLDLMALIPSCGLETSTPSRSLFRLGREMRAYVEDRLADPNLSVSSLARAFGVSPRHAHRVFAKFETTPSRYILDCRLGFAAARLRDAACAANITQIALDSGFSDSTSFSRAFRKKYRVAPRDFRRERRTN
jgi:AraC-like DNA-binding protein